MSAVETYFTIPLSILRSGKSARDALEQCVSCGIVNAGIGYKQANSADAFQSLLDNAMEEATRSGHQPRRPKNMSQYEWEVTIVGAKILKITGGDRATDFQIYQQNRHAGQVFFRIRSDWLWNAVYTAREEEGQEVNNPFKPISWSEFRILAAVLSAKVNVYGFVFQGWEGFQARACGFHTKTLFKANEETLPTHCLALSRAILRRQLDKLEALGFFARCRYSKGRSGGFMAYSFRHANREDLLNAVKTWAAANLSFGGKAAANRIVDRNAFSKSR